MWGDIAFYVPPSEKWGGHVPGAPQLIAPMPAKLSFIFCY